MTGSLYCVKTTNANYHPSNNMMERYNGEFRDWEKSFRGFKNPDSPLIRGFAVFFNMIKEHSALDGKTPGEAAKINIEGENKWITLIQNAMLHKKHTCT